MGVIPVMSSPVLTSTAVGFASAIGQVLILRELLVLSHGNELSTGLVLAGWLLWTAAGSWAGGGLCRRLHPSPSILGAGLVALAIALPLTLLWIRASRLVWSVPAGELFPVLPLLSVIVGTTSIFCLTSGCLFALAWSAQAQIPSSSSLRSTPLFIYLAEAMGAAAGGSIFHFFLLPAVSALSTALLVSAGLTVSALAVIFPGAT